MRGAAASGMGEVFANATFDIIITLGSRVGDLGDRQDGDLTAAA